MYVKKNGKWEDEGGEVTADKLQEVIENNQEQLGQVIQEAVITSTNSGISSNGITGDVKYSILDECPSNCIKPDILFTRDVAPNLFDKLPVSNTSLEEIIASKPNLEDYLITEHFSVKDFNTAVTDRVLTKTTETAVINNKMLITGYCSGSFYFYSSKTQTWSSAFTLENGNGHNNDNLSVMGPNGTSSINDYVEISFLDNRVFKPFKFVTRACYYYGDQYYINTVKILGFNIDTNEYETLLNKSCSIGSTSGSFMLPYDDSKKYSKLKIHIKTISGLLCDTIKVYGVFGEESLFDVKRTPKVTAPDGTYAFIIK